MRTAAGERPNAPRFSDGVTKMRASVARTLAETRVTTPEERLLKIHYDKMGLDDRARVARLDPSQHLYGCRCPLCDRTERTCPVDGCGKVFAGTVKLGTHLEYHKRIARSAAARAERAKRKQMEPVGLEFIARLLGDPERAKRLDLRGLHAFEQKLLASSGPTGGRLRAKNIAASKIALEVADGAPEGTTQFTTTVPNPTAAVIYRFAILAGVHPRAVTAALIAWGIERFVEQVRLAGVVDEPHVPRELARPNEPRSVAAAFPDEAEAL